MPVERVLPSLEYVEEGPSGCAHTEPQVPCSLMSGARRGPSHAEDPTGCCRWNARKMSFHERTNELSTKAMAMFSTKAMSSVFGVSAEATATQHASLLVYVTEKDAAGLTKAIQGIKATTINLVPSSGGTPLLHAAAAADAADCVQALIVAKADINLQDSSGATPCFMAVQNDAHAALTWLLGVGADLDKPRKSGATPVYVAAQNGTARCLKSLLDANADPNAPKEGGFTPTAVACLRGRAESLAMLIEAQANINIAATVADRFTPLMLAAHCGHDKLLEALLSAGASVTASSPPAGWLLLALLLAGCCFVA